MSSPLEDYLAALEARDAREKAHEKYINAFATLADRAASAEKQRRTAAGQPESSPSASTRTIRATKPNGQDTASPVPQGPDTVQLRTELAASNKIRGEQEYQIAALTAENSSVRTTNKEQTRQISRLQNANKTLERKLKDRTEELKGKQQFVEQAQDEMLALQLQLNMKEADNAKLNKDNEDLVNRWMAKKDEEARSMNHKMGWEDKTGR